MSVMPVGGVRADIAEMLGKIRDVSSRTNVFRTDMQVDKSSSFGGVLDQLNGGLKSVSGLQQQTDTVKNAYLMGDPNVSLSQVIVTSEKSKLAFEGLVTVRNKCLDAYKEIMNMPV